jgi:hypothetical protein
MRTARLTLFLALVSTLVATSGVAAQGSNLAFVYSVRPHAGQEMAFEAALKEHMAFRATNGDAFTWSVFQAMMGDDMGAYYIRSASHSWADLDAYTGDSEFQQAAGSHFGATIAPMLAGMSSSVTVLDTANSHQPTNMEEMNVFMITQVHVDGSAQIGMDAALTAYHETATANDMYHGILRTVVGGARGDLTIVNYAEDFAGLEEPSPTLNELMLEEHGMDDFREVGQAWLAGVEDTRSTVIVLRRDLMAGG